MPPVTRPTVTGAQIAADAMKYRGLGYVYGGDASSPGNWDCSSFVSYVLGHDLGLGLPGNGRFGEPGYPPHAHGPVVVDYANWTGARTVATGPGAANAARAGDLCCFVGLGASGHIGIATGSNRMVSALDTSQGTIASPIAGYGPYGAPLIIRRVLGVPAGPGIPQPGGPGGPGGVQPVVILMVLAGAVLAAAVLAAVAGAIVAGVAGYGAKKALSR